MPKNRVHFEAIIDNDTHFKIKKTKAAFEKVMGTQLSNAEWLRLTVNAKGIVLIDERMRKRKPNYKILS